MYSLPNKAEMILYGLEIILCLNGCKSLIKIQRLSEWILHFHLYILCKMHVKEEDTGNLKVEEQTKSHCGNTLLKGGKRDSCLFPRRWHPVSVSASRAPEAVV